jgi:homoserine O-succinyltransferase/O-acetyltransferase
MAPHQSVALTSPTPNPVPLRLCLIDMNNGVENQAIRCFKRIVEQFVTRARTTNPGLDASLVHVQPRNLGEQPVPNCDLYMSSGGPGSPFDGFEDQWCTDYRAFLDSVVEDNLRGGKTARGLFVVCHSFELAIEHFKFAKMEPRPTRKFGVQPAYMTEEGMRSPLLAPFGDRLFAWEHRYWQAVGLDTKRLGELGGELWARESRDGVSKGEGHLAFRFAHGIEGTLFHPEADRAGAMSWIVKPEQAEKVVEAYGDLTYRRMLKTLDDPMRLARTFALLIPGWLTRRFNLLAPHRGWNPAPEPLWDEAAQASFKDV